MDTLELKSIGELLDYSFYIPSYQRGYRWTPIQVTELLDDVRDYMQKAEGRVVDENELSNDADSFYCIQPLVVKEKVDESLMSSYFNDLEALKNNGGNIFDQTIEIINKYLQWEVIDGQQRLTTISLILRYLNLKSYRIAYETRNVTEHGMSTEAFLKDIEKNQDHIFDNIDFHHFYLAYESIKDWFATNSEVNRFDLEKTLLNSVKFIWYKTEDKDPVKVFTRLNIGKIALTNAELIKALFLNKSNFLQMSNIDLFAKQVEIAGQWDSIENALQNDEFWLFIHNLGYDHPTRIDFIFDIICNEDRLGIGQIDCGDDDYTTFRYFDKYIKSELKKKHDGISIIDRCWGIVLEIFNTIQEWYNDITLYHYIGFLIENKMPLTDLLHLPEGKMKQEFISEVKVRIKNIIKNCYVTDKGIALTDYDMDNCPSKTICRPLLLLHNIQTVISQNIEYTRHNEYQLGTFYKFPFHLLKKEHWDVEHIDSFTENPLTNVKDQKEWLQYAIIGMELDEPTQNKIKAFLCGKDGDNRESPTRIPEFGELYDRVINILKKKIPTDEMLQDSEKNRIWNFVLLDMSTNRGYGNSIFPAKRRTIMGKDRGIRYSLSIETMQVLPTENQERRLHELMSKTQLKEEEINEKRELLKYSSTAFIPPCTRNAFMKYYVTQPNNLLVWGRTDAKAYLNNIKVLLQDFIKD